jgi:hypothetical protein
VIKLSASAPFVSDNVIEVTPRTTVAVSATARNPGGVRLLTLLVQDPQGRAMIFETIDRPDSMNNVATELIARPDGTFYVCGAPWTVTATSENYNGQRSTVTVTIRPR